MKKIQYLDLFKKALSLTWENKFLWFFGFLIFIGSVVSNLNINSSSAIEQGKKFQLVADIIQQNPGLPSIFNLFFFLVIIFLFLLKIIATASIIKSANDISLYKQLSPFAILKTVKKYLGRLLLLEILIGTVLFIIALVLATPVLYLFALNAKAMAIGALIAAIAIMLPLTILAYYLYRYASFYLILADEKITLAIESAYGVFAKNIKESLLAGLLALLTNFLLLAAFFVVLFVLAVIFSPIGFISYLLFAKTGAMIILTLAALIFILALCAIISWYESFLQTFWLLFFQQIAYEKHQEKKILEKTAIKGEIPNPEAV